MEARQQLGSKVLGGAWEDYKVICPGQSGKSWEGIEPSWSVWKA